MNKLTELWIEQKTQWATPENKAVIRQECLGSIAMSGEIVKIEDILYPGIPDRYGNVMEERRFYKHDGRYDRIVPFRLHAHLDPLENNPLTLADVE